MLLRVRDSWLQCDACNKWRKVPASVEMGDLPETFVCADNDWEPEYASCDIPQEEWVSPQVTGLSIARFRCAKCCVMSRDRYCSFDQRFSHAD